MSTAPDNLQRFGPEWCSRPVVLVRGQADTHLHTGDDYDTCTLADLFTMQPGDAPKADSHAIIPSSYADFDARNHGQQRQHGQFIALCCDVDSGNHALDQIEGLVRGFAQDAAWLIYSTSHARPGDMRWRAILPLDQPLAFDDWHDAQSAFFDYMEQFGVEVDRSLARAGQLVYLPNVPAVHAKSGTQLRNEAGEPIYYARSTTGTNAPGLSIDKGAISVGLANIRRKCEADERERERIRKEAEERRAKSPPQEGAPVMEAFNRASSIPTLLELYGYERSQRNPDDWHSPNQTGDTYATRVMGDFWVSLSGSDVGARLGQACKAGCFGDAYDLFVHYEHGGDHKSAFRALYAERRASNPLPASEPPPVDSEDPGWTDAPEEIDVDMEADDFGETDAPDHDEIELFHPADWDGKVPPERTWRWQSFIPDNQATLLTGAGAAGKSLATQQMSTCIALGLPFLGVETRQAPSLYITCEDDMDELHRRQQAICASLGVALSATRGKLFLLSLQGEIGNELATFTAEGEMSIAPRYVQIERACLDRGIRHVTLDNTAHTFAGNENDRHQVAAFVNLNNRLARTLGGSVVMVGHPNKAGASYSGSTAWENQVRSRLYLEIPQNGEDGVPVDPDMRVLRNEKANYSQRGSEVTFYWLQGAFVTEEHMPHGNDRELRESARSGYENGVFLKLLDNLTQQKRQVSHAPNVGTFAPRIMAAMPEAKGLSKAALARAMERLFLVGEIEASVPLWNGPNRHPVLGLARAKS